MLFFMYNIICDIKGSESAVTPWNFPPFFPSDHPVLPLSCKLSKDECWLTASCNCRVAENGRMTSSASITCTACTATHFGFRTVDLLRLQNLKSFIFEVQYHSVQYKVWTKTFSNFCIKISCRAELIANIENWDLRHVGRMSQDDLL